MALALIGLIPLLPLAGFVVCGLLGRRLPKGAVTAVACGTILIAFLISVGAVLELRGMRGEGAETPAKTPAETPAEKAAEHGAGSVHATADSGHGEGTAHGAGAAHAPVRSYTKVYWSWIPALPFADPPAVTMPGSRAANPQAPNPGAEATDAPEVAEGSGSPTGPPLRVDFSFRLDPLSSVLLLVVTGVGFLIHVYSVGYMAHDAGYARYFAYLNLFTAMMLTLVLAGNFLVMFVGWEGVGLCSYLLIGFWYEDADKAQAGRKAFITNRIGDFAFMLGLLAILYLFHSLDFTEVMGAIAGGAGSTWALTLIALALFIGACGKSAQIPLYVWLPDAMAGPTPVSALIHAATMVTAGVYMVARCGELFVRAPLALTVVAIVGALTALFAATIGLAQNDIKKVLAYSTVSQLGYMFLGAGVGAFAGSIFHLMTHAFFKALLFLGAGSVIHAMSGEQDMRHMGGLKGKLPWTYRTMMVGALAIAGVPILAGFFSKDEILWRAWESGHVVLWAMGAAAAALTAFYMFRLVFMTFHGAFRGTHDQEHHLHESPPSMTVPLVILAGLSIVGGWVGIPAALGAPLGIPNMLEHWLEPVLAHAGGAEAGAGPGAEYALMFLAVAIAVGGIMLAARFYLGGGNLPDRIATAAGPLYGLVANKYWIDELYDAIVLRPFYAVCGFFDAIDRLVVDYAVNAAAGFTELVGQVLRLFQSGYVRNYALFVFLGTVMVLWILVR